MSTIIDVPSKMGEYMLKGWILTDKTCPNSGCNIPLMRSPAARSPTIHFCVNCDGDPDANKPLTLSASTSTSVTIPPALSDAQTSPSMNSSTTHYSRASTPPTELSSALSSPTFAPPVDTEESLRRRQQSDAASAEMGKRLLKGWAMLADECPNPTCYGIPLVRPPKAGGGKDPRKECVVCGSVYIDQKDANGWDRLVPMNHSSQNRPEFEERGSGSSIAGPSVPSSSRDKGKAVAQDETPSPTKRHLVPSLTDVHAPLSKVPRLDLSQSQAFSLGQAGPAIPPTNTSAALEVSARALEASLHALSERLNMLTSVHLMTLDPSSIGQTADAMTKVTQALSQVRQLQS